MKLSSTQTYKFLQISLRQSTYLPHALSSTLGRNTSKIYIVVTGLGVHLLVIVFKLHGWLLVPAALLQRVWRGEQGGWIGAGATNEWRNQLCMVALRYFSPSPRVLHSLARARKSNKDVVNHLVFIYTVFTSLKFLRYGTHRASRFHQR